MGFNFIIITLIFLVLKLWVLHKFGIISIYSSGQGIENNYHNGQYFNGHVFQDNKFEKINNATIDINDDLTVSEAKNNFAEKGKSDFRILQEQDNNLNSSECNINTVINKKLLYVNDTLEDKLLDIPYAIALPSKCNYEESLLYSYTIGYYKNPFAYNYKYGPKIISYVVSFKNLNKNTAKATLKSDRFGIPIEYDPPILLKIPFYNIPTEQTICYIYEYKRESRLWKKDDRSKIVKISNTHQNVDKLNIFISIVNDGEFGITCDLI